MAATQQSGSTAASAPAPDLQLALHAGHPQPVRVAEQARQGCAAATRGAVQLADLGVAQAARRGAALVRSRRRVRRHTLTKSQIPSSAQCFVLIPRVPVQARRSWVGR